MNMSAKTRIKTALPKQPSRDAWSKAWQEHWSKVGLPGYELPGGGLGGGEGAVEAADTTV